MAFLTLTNISKKYNQTAAVEDFNLEVEAGEFISFLGPSGCGKTTTLRMIAGFELPTSGTIQIKNEEITFRPPNQRNVGMVFQSYALFPNMTVGENIGFGLKVAHRPESEIRERVEEMLALIHMQQFGKRYPYQMSGGQQQRVALARALAIHPQVLLLDEPLSALDAKIRLSLRTEIRAIQQKLGITTVYVTHDQEEALSLSDRVVVMSEGHIEQIGTPFEIYNFPKTRFVASFVGTLNVIDAVVADREGKLRLDKQEVSLSCPVSADPGDTIQMALRPELISLESDIENANHLDARIEKVTFLGSIVRIQVSLETQRLFLDIFNNPNLVLPKLGDRVTLSFPREACLLLGGKQPQGVPEESPIV
ncbi:MAG: ABC transporter ATP-binding protein [Anaerolineaceae bacterium]|nr:ABC transporter ATP-binding protein [Anaerolineaceae bacterium]